MAELNFDATKVPPAKGFADDDVESLMVNETIEHILDEHDNGEFATENHIEPLDAEARRKRGRPPIPVDPASIQLEEGYKAKYRAYLQQCREQNDALEMAQLTLKEALAEKKKAVDAWDVFIAQLRKNVLDIKSAPKPTPPIKEAT